MILFSAHDILSHFLLFLVRLLKRSLLLIVLSSLLACLLVLLVSPTVDLVEYLLLDGLARVADHRILLSLIVYVLLVVLFLHHLLVVPLFVLLLKLHNVVCSFPRLLNLLHKLFFFVLKHLNAICQHLRVIVHHLPRIFHTK